MALSLWELQLTLGLLLAGHGAQKLFGWFGGTGLRRTTDWLATIAFRPAHRPAVGPQEPVTAARGAHAASASPARCGAAGPKIGRPVMGVVLMAATAMPRPTTLGRCDPDGAPC